MPRQFNGIVIIAAWLHILSFEMIKFKILPMSITMSFDVIAIAKFFISNIDCHDGAGQLQWSQHAFALLN